MVIWKLVGDYAKTHTVVAKNIGILAILSENPTLLSENSCSCKCFGTHMSISLVCVGTTQKHREEKSNLIQSHTETQKYTGQNYWHPV